MIKLFNEINHSFSPYSIFKLFKIKPESFARRSRGLAGSGLSPFYEIAENVIKIQFVEIFGFANAESRILDELDEII